MSEDEALKFAHSFGCDLVKVREFGVEEIALNFARKKDTPDDGYLVIGGVGKHDGRFMVLRMVLRKSPGRKKKKVRNHSIIRE